VPEEAAHALTPPGRTVPLQGAQRLLLAVLQEAIGTFQRYATARDRPGRTAFRQAAAWFASDETGRVFSYLSVCDALGIDAAYVRAGLRRWMTHRAPFEAESPPDPRPFREPAGSVARWPALGPVASPRPWAGPGREHGGPVPSRAYRGSGGKD